MIYYQIGPTRKGRTRNTGGAVSSSAGSREAFGGYLHADIFPEFVGAAAPDREPDRDLDSDSDLDLDSEKPLDNSEDGKVLYIFNGGKTELRPLDEAAGTPQSPREDGGAKENPNYGAKGNPNYPDDDDVG
jgi:hypothetical protein